MAGDVADRERVRATGREVESRRDRGLPLTVTQRAFAAACLLLVRGIGKCLSRAGLAAQIRYEAAVVLLIGIGFVVGGVGLLAGFIDLAMVDDTLMGILTLVGAAAAVVVFIAGNRAAGRVADDQPPRQQTVQTQ